MSHTAVPRAPHRQADSTDVARRLVGVVALLATAVTSILPMASQVVHHGPWAWLGVAGLLGNQLAALGLLLAPPHRRERQPWPMLLVLLLALLPISQYRYDLSPIDLWPPATGRCRWWRSR